MHINIYIYICVSIYIYTSDSSSSSATNINRHWETSTKTADISTVKSVPRPLETGISTGAVDKRRRRECACTERRRHTATFGRCLFLACPVCVDNISKNKDIAYLYIFIYHPELIFLLDGIEYWRRDIDWNDSRGKWACSNPICWKQQL